MLSDQEYNRIINVIKIFNLPSLKNLKINTIMAFIDSDKKNIKNQLNYILLSSIGKAKIKTNYNKESIKEGLGIL